MYKILTQEGYKVFFARVTLEDKLGTKFEPYIFSALNSSKVMLALGTNKENFNAVWVKNEWSRYLALIKNGESRTLIPLYKDMSPYDLPEELAKEKKADTTGVIVETMLSRGKEFLVKKDWIKARQYFDNVLDYESYNAEAHLGNLFIDYEVSTFEELSKLETSIKTNENYNKIAQSDSIEILEKLDGCEEAIQQKIFKIECEKKNRNRNIFRKAS